VKKKGGRMGNKKQTEKGGNKKLKHKKRKNGK
jgi:hypothetical protein